MHDSEEVDDLQTDDSVASVIVVVRPWFKEIFFFSFLDARQNPAGVRGEVRVEGGAGKWTRADCRLCVHILCGLLPSVPSSLRTEPSSVTAGQASKAGTVPVPRKVSL